MSTRPYKDSQCFAGAWLRQGLLTTMIAMGCWLGGGKTGQCKEIRLVEDGKPLAAIVVASNASHAAAFAAQELRDHIEKITGAKLAVVTDDKEIKGAKILVGESAATWAMGLRGSDFQPQEYLVRVTPEDVVLMGRDGPEPVPDFIQAHGGVESAEGKFGKGLKFNKGVVTCNVFAFPDNEGAVEFWLWMPAQGAEREVWRVDGERPWTYHILQFQKNNSLKYIVYFGGTNGRGGENVESGPLAEGWHYVKTSHSLAGNKITLAVDGRVQGEAKHPLPTNCSGARRMNIGGVLTDARDIRGSRGIVLDEVRVSKVTRSSETNIPSAAFSADPDTLLLLHFDEGTTEKIRDATAIVRKMWPPVSQTAANVWRGEFVAHGTCYAVYDFLERCCGVRWYMPGELGVVFTPSRALAVKDVEIRRRPQFIYRYTGRRPEGTTVVAWNHPTDADLDVFWCRMRWGGENIPSNHSLYGYYDRFWKKNTNCPEVFEGEHPEYFAVGDRHRADWRAKQLCYSNSNLISQVVRDARDYFDGKGLKPGAVASGKYFSLVPMDHGVYCKCPACRAQFDPAKKIENYSSGYASDYIWRFVNAVAVEVKKSHPDKYISAIAYYNYAYYPEHVQLETNIAVSLCLAESHMWGGPVSREGDMVFYREWIKKEKGRRPLTLWLYYHQEYLTEGKYHCFAPFYAHTLSEQFKLFARDGILGMIICGDGFPVLDKYLIYKFRDDPAQDVDQMMHEFFERFYGPAGKPMEAMYSKIEAIYNDPKNWPTNATPASCDSALVDEKRCWEFMGTEERMAELGRLMEEAKAAGGTEAERKRVELFEKSVWDYMVEGRKMFLAKPKKTPQTPEQKAFEEARQQKRDQLKKTMPLPQIKVPRLKAALKGEVKNVDWSQSAVVTNWHTLLGDPTNRPATARLLHDGEFLYIQLAETVETSKLISKKDVFGGDDWELFFAHERKKYPSSHLAIAPQGDFRELSHEDYGENEWRSGAIVKSDISKTGEWITTIALPLQNLLPGGVKSGQKIYANLYRQCAASKDQPVEYLAWSPNFEKSFHSLDRLGELTLE